MGLVDYSSSSEDDDGDEEHTAKKRKLSGDTDLPPLPAHFRDLYSSTVRTSTQDDPSLHGGRKRVTPHVVGNWPAHVFLEWTPDQEQQTLLADLISKIQKDNSITTTTSSSGKQKKGKDEIHTLLDNELGVPLPLHISLSRPLALKTPEKDGFLANLTSAITAANIRTFKLSPGGVKWHSNEDRTRWFLVLALQRPERDELRMLLEVCNQLAGEFGQPLLYHESKNGEVEDAKFHLSLAWSLNPQEGKVVVSENVEEGLKDMEVGFEEVKVRIGQDVASIPLRKRRGVMLGR